MRSYDFIQKFGGITIRREEGIYVKLRRWEGVYLFAVNADKRTLYYSDIEALVLEGARGRAIWVSLAAGQNIVYGLFFGEEMPPGARYNPSMGAYDIFLAPIEEIVAPRGGRNPIIDVLAAAGVQVTEADLKQAMLSNARPARALSKILHDRGQKVDPDVLSRVGGLFRLMRYRLEERDRIDWHAGDFGDHGSCFWGSKTSDRMNLQTDPSFRAYVVFDGERGVGRCLSLQIGEGRLYFNMYGLSLTEFSVLFNLNGTEVFPVTANYTGNAFYLNRREVNGEVNALYTLPAEIVRFDDKDIKIARSVCVHCGGAAAEHTTPVGVVCQRCINHFVQCHFCGEYYPPVETINDAVHVLPVVPGINVCRSCAGSARFTALREGGVWRAAVIEELLERIGDTLPDVRAICGLHNPAECPRCIAAMAADDRRELADEIELVASEIWAMSKAHQWPRDLDVTAYCRDALAQIRTARSAGLARSAAAIARAWRRVHDMIEDMPEALAAQVYLPTPKLVQPEFEMSADGLVRLIDRVAEFRADSRLYRPSREEVQAMFLHVQRTVMALARVQEKTALQRWALRYLDEQAGILFASLSMRESE